MNRQQFVAGFAVALVCLSVPAGAYHVHGDIGPAGLGSLSYVAATPINDPCRNAVLGPPLATLIGILSTLPAPLGGPGGIIDTMLENGCLFDGVEEACIKTSAGGCLLSEEVQAIVCESDDFLGSGIATPGHGGLCYMSPGYDQNPSSCDFNGLAGGSDAPGGPRAPAGTGRSNGNDPDVDGDGTCGGYGVGTGSTWYVFRMGTSGSVYYSFGGFACEVADGAVLVDTSFGALFADKWNHVTGLADTPGDFGTYTVTQATAAQMAAVGTTAAACGIPSWVPMYHLP